MKNRRTFVFAAAVGLTLLLVLLWLVGTALPAVVHAASLTVDVTNDENDPAGCVPGDCSLREAIIEANTNGEDDTIYLDADTYQLSLPGPGDGGGDLDIQDDDGHTLTIVGQGAGQTVIDANGIDRVFEIHPGAGMVTLEDVSIIGGSTTGNGGGVYNSDADLELIDSVVSTNTAEYGAGVFVLSGQATLIGGEIRGNTAITDGGGVYVNLSTATFRQDSASIIAGNVVTGNGGGVFVYDGNATLSGDTSDNEADDGGGVYVFSGTVTLDGGRILDNVATNGAGVYVSQSEAIFTQTGATSAIAYNSTDFDGGGNGGGVYISAGQMTLDAGQVLDNNVPNNQQGGGVFVGLSTATFVQNEGSQIIDNFAGYGGGVFVSRGKATLNGGQIVSNTAEHDGGGVHVNYDGATLTQSSLSSIAYNEANDGGGVYIHSGQTTLSGGRIYDNLADDGGGVFLLEDTASLTSNGGQIVGNTAESRGGALFVTDGTVGLINTTISGNDTATTGGALQTLGGTTVMTNTTFVSSTRGRGLQVEGDGTVEVKNSIIAHHSGSNCNVVGGTLTSNGHNIEDTNTCGFSEPGDQPSTDPMLGPLADNGGDTWTHALLPGSPAVDAGDDTACPATDQRGVPRPQGAHCDIGAYEARLSVSVQKTVDDNSPDPNQLITYSIVIENNGERDVTSGTVSDTIPAGLTFAGPVTLDPPAAGITGVPPTLVSDLTVAAGDRVTITFPVTVDFGLAGGTVIRNVAAVTSAEVSTPETGAVEVTVQNVAPVASDATFYTNEYTPLHGTLPAEDANGDALTYALSSAPVTGTVSLTDPATGDFVYTPTVGTSDYDAVFSYVVTDTADLADTGTITVSVHIGNAPPTASDDTVSTDEDTAVGGTIVATDPDPDDTLTYTISTDPTYGTASIDASTGAWDYVPANRTADYTDSFVVTVTDSVDNTDTATVTINVTADNDPPVATGETVSIGVDDTAMGVVSATDPDEDDTLTFSITDDPDDGSAAINSSSGAWQYQPDVDAAEDYTDTFVVTVTDGGGNTDTATITVQVEVALDEYIIYLPLVAKPD